MIASLDSYVHAFTHRQRSITHAPIQSRWSASFIWHFNIQVSWCLAVKHSICQSYVILSVDWWFNFFRDGKKYMSNLWQSVQKTLLNNHERINHNAFYECPCCGKRMKYLKNFSKHYVDTCHGTLSDAKNIERTLQVQYSEDTIVDDGKRINRFLLCICVYLYWLQIQIASADVNLVCRNILQTTTDNFTHIFPK